MERNREAASVPSGDMAHFCLLSETEVINDAGREALLPNKALVAIYAPLCKIAQTPASPLAVWQSGPSAAQPMRDRRATIRPHR
jgi:hypothetical protein